MLLNFSLSLALLSSASALPTSSSSLQTRDANRFQTISVNSLRRRRPVVIWHGLGDSAGSEGMVRLPTQLILSLESLKLMAGLDSSEETARSEGGH